jgi:Carboxypeptidase regulatory-like domain/TonB dependent receptor
MKYVKWSRLACAIGAACVLMLGAAAPLFAQSTTDGAIGGLVSDQSGGSVPGATVTARNLATNSTAEAVSDGTGRFLVIRLQPGVYSVEVNLTGFTPFKRDSIVVEVGRVTNLEIPLGVAGQTETVQVTAQAPIINTEQSDFSTNINQTQIANLPTNTRRWSTFALMTPGAAPDGNFGLVSFRGISGLLNSNTVDGGDNTQAFFAEERGRTRLAYSVSADAVREFQVSTSNYSAEQGRAAGGAVNAVTKSGTNDLHGSGFYFIRDNKWASSNPFQVQTVLVNGVNTTQQIKPDDRRQQFGGTVGGPIEKDRAFFFFSYDQQKRNFPGVAVPSSPSAFFAPFTNAELTTLAGRGISVAQANDGLAFMQGLTGVVARTGDQTLFLPKVDVKFDNNHSLAVTYNRLRWDSPAGVQTAAVVNRGVESWGNDGVHDDWATARFNSVLGARMTNEVKFQWGRDFEFQSSQDPLPGEPVSSSGRTPAVDISGAAGLSFGKPNFLERRAYPDERRIEFGDTLTMSIGPHLIKVGGDVSRVYDKLDSLFQEGGVYAYASRVDFITDFETRASANPTRAYTSFSQGIGPSAFEFHTFDYDVFIQDTWHANPRTTLNLGLRYDYEQMPKPQIPNPLLPATSQFPADKNNFGPRIGVAYDVSGKGDTVVRGGYGIFYGRIINSSISNAITNVGSTAGQLSLQLLSNQAGAPTFPNILASASATPVRPDVVVFQDDAQNPLIHQYDAIVEQRIAENTMVSVSYVGSQGRNLPLFIDANLPNPSGTVTYQTSGGPLDGQAITLPIFTGARPNTNFGRITTIATTVDTKYNGLILQLNRRLSKGVQVQASYTEARATDNGQKSQTFTSSNNVLNPFDLGLEQGTSDFEIKHRFVANAILAPVVGAEGTMTHTLLSGFTISPTLAITSGIPYTALLTGNTPIATRIQTGVLGAGGTNRLPQVGRNTFALPKTANLDLRIARAFALGAGHRVEGIVDIFNLTNRMNYTSVNQTMYTVGGTAAAPTLTYNAPINGVGGFGALTNGNNNYFVFTPRQVQLALRYSF